MTMGERDNKQKQRIAARKQQRPGVRSSADEGKLVVSSELLLAAIDRAERHRTNEHDLVPLRIIVAHLGLARTGWTTRRLRPELDALVADGLLVAGRVVRLDAWALSDAGRTRLEVAQQAGGVPRLPESPQHRAWRDARSTANGQIEGLRANVQAATDELLGLLGSRRRARSDTWLLLAARLRESCRQLGLATYCLDEWAQPDDARADIDDYHDPGDEQLNRELLGLLRWLREYRRTPSNLNLNQIALQATPPTPLITVSAELRDEIYSGLGTVLGNAASRVAKVTYTPDREFHPEWYAPHRERFEHACALLDLIGWSEPQQSVPIQVNAREHGQTMIEALEVRLIVYDDELDQDDLARARDELLKQHAKSASRAKVVNAFTAALKELLNAPDNREPRLAGAQE